MTLAGRLLGEKSSQVTEQTPTFLTGNDVSEMMVVEDEHVLPWNL